MSVMFTLIRYRPILLSSGSTLARIAVRKLSRSWLICSMRSEATVRRSWPKMISLRHLLDVARLEAEQALGGVLHDRRLRADADRERARHVDADVLQRQRALQRDADRQRRELEERVVLDQRPDQRAAAVDAARRLPLADLAVDHQDHVRRAALVARREEHQGRREQHEQRQQRDAPVVESQRSRS